MKKTWISVCLASTLIGTVFVIGCGSNSNTTNSSTTNANPSNANEPAFKYAMSGLYKPFNFKENGQLQGFDVEIGEALAAKLHMKPEPVTNPWETVIQGLQAKKYDAILGSMTVTPEREMAVDFTEPYYRSGSEIFVAANNTSIKSASDLKGKKIGVVKASNFKTLALTLTSKENVMEYDSDITALMDLPTGRLDAVITDQMVGFRMMKESGAKIKDVGLPLTHDDQAIAIRKGDTALKDKINKALDEIVKDGTFDKISDKWFGRSILGANKK